MSFSETTHEVRMLAVVQKLIGDGVDVRAHLTHGPWIELGDHEPLESVLKALQFFRREEGLYHFHYLSVHCRQKWKDTFSKFERFQTTPILAFPHQGGRDFGLDQEYPFLSRGRW